MENKQLTQQIDDLQIALDLSNKLLSTVNSKEEYILHLQDKIGLAKKILELDEERLRLLKNDKNNIDELTIEESDKLQDEVIDELNDGFDYTHR